MPTKLWEKGKSGNPKGRPPDALNAALKKLTKQELEEIGSMVVKGTLADLKSLIKNDQSNCVQAMVAGMVIKIVKHGDASAFNAIMDRLVGKVKQGFEHTGIPAAAPAQVIVTIPSNGREAKVGGN